jgi:hypothetical protein
MDCLCGRAVDGLAFCGVRGVDAAQVTAIRCAWLLAGVLFIAALVKHVYENGLWLFWQQNFGGMA